MKVLLVTKELGYRGTPRALANYAFILARKYDVHVWGYETGGETYDRLKEAGFKVYSGMECFEQLLSLKPDILNIHRAGVTCKIETEILKRFKQIECKCIETNVFGRVDWSVESILDISIQISYWDLYRWNAWKGGYKVPGVYLPYPVNLEAFKSACGDEVSSIRQEWNISDRDTHKAFVLGRIGKTKWEWLTKPLCDALEEFENLYFVNVLDYSGESMPECLLRHPRVHNQKRLVGAKELSRFYSSCDACVNMSWNGESFGYVNAEPMACETPVIALSTPFYDNAQVEMLVGNGGGGIVISSPERLGEALSQLIGSAEMCLKMGRVARKSIEERYSEQCVSPMLLKVFECCMSKHVEVAIRNAVKEKLLVTTISRNQIFALLKTAVGGLSVLKLVAIRMYHSCIGYIVVSLIKKSIRCLSKRGG